MKLIVSEDYNSDMIEEEQLLLSISDTRCGIPEENMKRIFGPLFTTKTRGIVLGWAVSKNLVEVNEGSIEVESKVGRGSTFMVILPTLGADSLSRAESRVGNSDGGHHE